MTEFNLPKPLKYEKYFLRPNASDYVLLWYRNEWKGRKTCRNGTMRAVQAGAKEKNSTIVYNVLKCSLHFRIDAVECNTMQANHSIWFYYWK